VRVVEAYRRSEDPIDRELAISELAASDEPGALAFLLDELTRARGESREMLLDGVLDFGSRDAIPHLLDLAEVESDPEEKAALVEAAEYLALPTLTEVREGKVPLGKQDAP
jgi:hypothetical protein